MKGHCRKHRGFWQLGLLALISFVWVLIRTGQKPSRITYPCQRTSLANINVFLLTLISVFSLGKPKLVISRSIDRRILTTFALVTTLIFASGLVPASFDSKATGSLSGMVPLRLDSMRASIATEASDLFVIQNASGYKGDFDWAVTVLLQLMEDRSLFFYQTGENVEGLIGKEDVVLIKINSQWSERGGTNTDLVKSIVKKIVNHPEGFVGEVVIADNGQGYGSLNWARSNAYNHSQSMQSVVAMFPSFRVSTYRWDNIKYRDVDEFQDGDFGDGYVVNYTRNPVTNIQVSYPKFTTSFGTPISFKKGIWDNVTNSYDSDGLKVINMPVLKSHSIYGVTACVKNYMGVVTERGWPGSPHLDLQYGAMGTEMVETRYPSLNILDAVWINANPLEYNNAGPQTSYGSASFTNIICAGQDAVAIDYWTSKHILLPTAVFENHTDCSSLDPDYEQRARPSMIESFHNYLERSMNEIRRAGHLVTMNEANINIFVSSATVPAEVNLQPFVLNLVSEKTHVLVRVELPESYNPSNIQYPLLLINDSIAADLSMPIAIDDLDNDSIADLLVFFSRTNISKFVLSQGITYGSVTFSLMGLVSDETPFEGFFDAMVRMPGDVNIDGSVGMDDIFEVAHAFGSQPSSPRWNSVTDENDDGYVGIDDMFLVASNFGRTYS